MYEDFNKIIKASRERTIWDSGYSKLLKRGDSLPIAAVSSDESSNESSGGFVLPQKDTYDKGKLYAQVIQPMTMVEDAEDIILPTKQQIDSDKVRSESLPELSVPTQEEEKITLPQKTEITPNRGESLSGLNVPTQEEEAPVVEIPTLDDTVKSQLGLPTAMGSNFYGISAGGVESGELIENYVVKSGYLRSSNYVVGVSGWNIEYDGTAQFADLTLIGGVIRYGKTTFDNVDNGYIIGPEDEVPKFYLGNSTYYLNWDGSGLILKPQYSNLQLYETVVDAAGHGDYTTLGAAVAAGKTRIFIRNGTYSETLDSDVEDHTMIIGESKEGVIIDFGSGNLSIRINNTASSYVTGTISATTGDATITGDGTTWSNLSAGEYISVGNEWYEIDSITDNTHLELSDIYRGEDISGTSYIAGPIKSGVIIKYITVQNSNINGITLARLVSHCIIENCILKDNTIGIAINESLNNSIRYNDIYNNSNVGLSISNKGYANIIAENNITNNAQPGISITSNASNNIVKNNNVSNNNGGITIISTGEHNQIIGNQCNYNNNDGIRLIATCDENIISNNTCTGNAGYGIDIEAATCDENIVTSNQLKGNTTGSFNDDGTLTSSANNIV